ncbi:MAG TPA: FoF1 ATP synthase subunit a [Candidatus Paceibacterota bacterium]|nr:FoF1 ATP synthase subunit a [Candidatus Paceibacterota bacterium]
MALAPEHLGTFFGIPVTNSLVMGWIVVAILLTVGFFVGRNVRLIPGKVQNFFEMIFEFVIDYMESTLGSRALAIKYFPLIMSIFLFIVTANLLDFFPFIGSIGIQHEGHFVPLLRPMNTDLNVTLALAIIAFFVIEITGIIMLGFLRYGSKFVNLKQGVMGFMVGIMELIGNLARLVSFSFRLFGNIFAGEILIAVAIAFLPLFLPVPLMLFETFVGVMQAAIFALLTLAFIKIAISEPHESH